MGPQHVVNGWTVQETGPEHPDHKVLLLPGALATARFYDDLVAEPAVSAIGFAVSTLPGFGGTAPLDGADMATYASSATRLARELRCDAVVGHSLGANVALEMAGAGLFTGPMLLLSPSFSRKDESKFPRTLDRLGTVLGPLPYAAMLHIIGPAMKGSMLPADRRTQEERPQVPPRPDASLSGIPGRARLTRLAAV
jgi:pimeloyl-ACP methyl ester carboxylesterase